MRIEDDIEIAAPVEDVWELTTRIEGLPDITPTITAVERLDEGPVAVGSRARLTQPGRGPATWTVTRMVPTEEFSWSTRLATVSMTATHRLRPTEGGCHQTLSIDLDGVGASLLGRVLRTRILEALETENAGFRARAESSASATGEP